MRFLLYDCMCSYLRNNFGFWNVHGSMNTSVLLLLSKCMSTLKETRSIHDSMKGPKLNLLLIFTVHFIINMISNV